MAAGSCLTPLEVEFSPAEADGQLYFMNGFHDWRSRASSASSNYRLSPTRVTCPSSDGEAVAKMP